MRLSAGERTRLQIQDAAILVIAKEGIESVTHRRVGQEAGLSHGVVSYHFPTRDELIYESFEHFLGNVEDHQRRYGWSPTQKMTKRQIVGLLTTGVAEELASGTTTRVEQELILYATHRPELAALYNRWEQEVVDALAVTLKRSSYRQPGLTARILISLVRGFLLECLTNPSLTEKDFRQRASFMLTSLSPQDVKLA